MTKLAGNVKPVFKDKEIRQACGKMSATKRARGWQTGMENQVDMDFYKGRDEEAFLEAWEAKHGSVSEEELDELYVRIAESIHYAIKNGKHKLGEEFVYEGITVGQSDYNEFHRLYLFTEGS